MRSIGVLVGGSAAAHGITALAMPVSTRLFTPDDFSTAATFASLVGILIAAACLRFDMAIPLPERDEEAVNLLALSAAGAAGIAGLLALVIAVMPISALGRFQTAGLVAFLPLVPVAVLLGGLYLALQMWFVRFKHFGRIAQSRIAQSSAAAGGQIGLGALGVAPLGLIVGQILNYGSGTFILGAQVLGRHRTLLRQVSARRMVAAFKAYERFPRYSVWEALANEGAIHLPILLIAAFAVGPEAGYLALAIFLLQAPMSLFGNAVGQVYLSGAPEALREGRIGAYTAEIVGGLLRIVSGPMAFLAIAAPAAFNLAFGSDWIRSGVLATWMVPWFLLQFLSSPISTALHVTGRQKVAMILQVAGLFLRVGPVLAAAAWAHDVIAEVYALSGFVFYGIYMAVVLRSVGIGFADLKSPLLKSLLPTFLGVVAGLLATPLFAWIKQMIVT